MIDLSHSEEIYTVSRLNREARFLLENHFPLLWVEGEISGFKAHTSGHWYFSLKDEAAQIRCALFRRENRSLGFQPKDGMHVLVKVRVSLYENRGDYQLIAEHMEDIGEGKLRQAFEALKKRLAEAGYFDLAKKKPLPLFPRSIGVVTSPTGAAIRDILSVLKRRYRTAPVILYPTLVQGETAAENITDMLKQANTRQECDVLLLARGGGSLEDLWCFNDERVAKAIYESEIPIVSAIGHEIDFTIADFVADLRAATPTAAAELITPDQTKLAGDLTDDEKHLTRIITQKIIQYREKTGWLEKNLQQQHPKRKLQEQSQQLDYFEMNLTRLQEKHIADLQKKLQIVAAKMDALSPLATLQRGFSITTRVINNTILDKADDVNIGDKIHIRLMKGNLECTVDGKS
ncbi:MAG TPA: exodeoxyribonuclease VII large subunit [Gammaproteobacteria bacterium]|nr:exodeoxyribonuclease VII large subunit [Gammaproteobacteria bacterium]